MPADTPTPPKPSEQGGNASKPSERSGDSTLEKPLYLARHMQKQDYQLGYIDTCAFALT